MSNAVQAVAQVALLPGQLDARVLLHDIAAGATPVPCWIYVTDGLRALGQREIAFVLRRHPSEAPQAFPPDPLRFFATVHGLAAQGRLVDVGGVSEFAPGFFGDAGHRGLAYLSLHPDMGLPLAPDTLVAVALVGAEMDAAKRHGATRVMAWLGRSARQYPCPPWYERARPSLAPPTALEQTVLAGVPSLHTAGTSAVSEGERLTLRVAPSSHAAFRDAFARLPPGAAFALLCDLDPRADACLVWQPGQQAPEGISPPGSRGGRVAGAFLVVAGQQAEEAAQIAEDGFALLLRDASEAALRQALATGGPLSLPTRGMSFSIAWDAGAAPPGPGRARAAGDLIVRLGIPTHELGRYLAPDAFAAYASAIEQAVARAVGALPPAGGHDLWLGVALRPGGTSDVRIASRPHLDATALAPIHAAVQAVPTPSVAAPLAFHAAAALWGGTGAPLDPGSPSAS